jgi:hypothetical protein
VNGEIVRDVRTLEIICARDPNRAEETLLGVLEYGAEPGVDEAPSPYDTWLFFELGGVVTLPFSILDGRLLVGVVEQRRFAELHPVWNPRGMVCNAPRGFHNWRREADETALRELRGEVGVFPGETFDLGGEALNFNNSWMKYRDQLQEGKPVAQGGVKTFGVEVNPDFLEKRDDRAYVIKSDRLGERPKGSPYEIIGRCLFLGWTEATNLRDTPTVASIARLLACLLRQNRVSISLKG